MNTKPYWVTAAPRRFPTLSRDMDFDAAVAHAERCPIFDEGGSVEIARLAGPAG